MTAEVKGKLIAINMDSPSVQYLSKKDSRLKKLISEIGDITYTLHDEDSFVFLVHEIIEQMLSVKAGQAIFNRLVELWPELFNREKPQPLKVEIPDDLIQDIAIRELAFGAGALRAAVASYVQSPRYYRALMAGGARYDLKGQPCGEVTPQEQKEAETRLMVLNDRQKARKPR